MNERRFRRLIENSTDLVAVLDGDATVRYVSPSVQRLLGRPEEAVIGTSVFDLVHDDDRARVVAFFAEHVAKPGPTSPLEYRLRHRDGSWVCVETVATNLLADPTVAGVVINTRDVTERKRTEEAHRLSEERYRTLVETMSEAMVLTDRDERIVFVNDRLCGLLGYGREELVGRTTYDILATADDTATLREHLALRQQGVADRYELGLRSKDGGTVWTLMSGAPLRDTAGRVTGTIGVATDITERRRVEVALRGSEERYRTLLQTMSEGLVVVDLDEVITFVNDRFCDLVGYRRDQLIGSSVFTLVASEEDAATLRAHVALRPRGISDQYELRYRTGSGTILWVLIGGAPLRDAHGAVVGALGIVADITERKRAEEAVAAQRAFLRQVIDVNPSFIIVRDATGRITLVNESAARAYGTTVEQLEGRLETDVDPDLVQAERFLQSDRQVLETGRSLVIAEEVVSDRVQSVRWVQTYKGPIRATDGGEQVLIVTTDITAHKQAQLLQAAVYRIAQATDSAANLDDLYRAVHAIIREVMPVRNFYIALVTPPGDGLSFPYFVDERDPPPGPQRMQRGLTEYVIRARTPLLCRAEEAEELERRGEVELLGTPCEVWLGVPLSVGARTLGAMVVQDYERSTGFGERELQVLEYVSSQVAKAIERKRVEAALRESEERYRALYEQNPSMYFIVEKDGVVASVNRFGAEQLGYAVEELVGRSVLDVFHPDDVASVRRQLRTCLAAPGEVLHWELRKVRKDGSVLWVKEAARAVARADGTMAAFVVCEDVTKHKEAELAQASLQADVQRSALEWRRTFDSIESPILILDPEGRVVRLNETAKRLAQRSYDDLLGIPVRAVADGEPWRHAGNLVERVRATGAAGTAQVHDEPTDRTWDLVASLVTTPDGEARVIVVARDITRLVQLQDSLRRSETMSAMGSLVAGVAHEVRNPLFNMTATLDAFEALYEVREEYQKHLVVLRAQLERLTDLMQDLLNYGKPPSLDLVPVAIEEVIALAIAHCQRLASDREVRLESRVPPALPALPMDRKRMTQVFANLIENAVQHSPPRRTVAVRAALLAAAGGQWVECVVADSGPGFKAHEIPRLFEPFFTRRHGGTGLGLSLVQRIVEQHGGRVSAENGTEGGAMIRVRLPIAPESGLDALIADPGGLS